MRSLSLLLGFMFFCLTGFSQEKGTFEDVRDGKIYKTVKIGDKWIMAENLAYKPSKGNYWAHNNDPQNIEKYGYLYDWQTAKDIVPKGWHLPTKEELYALYKNLGDNEKKVFLALQELGFMASHGGWRYVDGQYFGFKECDAFWSSSINKPGVSSPTIFYNRKDYGIAFPAADDRVGGASIRLFKD
jgi:uncharacterized protein (TIGR02145 family)